MSDLLHDLAWSSRLSSSSSCSSTAAFVDPSAAAARLSALPHNAFSLLVPPQHAVSRLQSFDALLSSLSSSAAPLSRLPSFSALASYAPLPLLDDSAPFYDFQLPAADDASYLGKRPDDLGVGVEYAPTSLRSSSYESDGSSGDSLPPLSPHSTDSYPDSAASSTSTSASHSSHSSPPPQAMYQLQQQLMQHQQQQQQQRSIPLLDMAAYHMGHTAFHQQQQQQQPYYLPAKQQPLPSYPPYLPSLPTLAPSKEQCAPRSDGGWYAQLGGLGGESVPVLPLPATAAVHYSFSNNYSGLDHDDADGGSDSDASHHHHTSHHGHGHKRRQREVDYTLSPTSIASSPAARTRSHSGSAATTGGSARRDSMLSHVLKQEGRRREPHYASPTDGQGDGDHATQSPTHSAGPYSPASVNGHASSAASYSSASAAAPQSPFTFSPSQSDSPRTLLLSLAQHARSSHTLASTPASAPASTSARPPAAAHRFASYSATASSLLPGLDPNEVVVGIYTRAERAAKIARYREKRANRHWKKKIMYDCRKSFADNRPRVGGRFIKMKGEGEAGGAPAVVAVKEERRESKRARR